MSETSAHYSCPPKKSIVFGVGCDAQMLSQAYLDSLEPDQLYDAHLALRNIDSKKSSGRSYSSMLNYILNAILSKVPLG